MAKDVIVALSAVFLLWVGAIFVASSRLVWGNWPLFRKWRQQDRETTVKMALWLAIPVLMGCSFWMRSIAIWHYAAVYGIPTLSLVQMFIYLPAILAALAGILWWACDRTFNPQKTIAGAEQADRICRWILWAGAALCVCTFLLTRLLD
jgi:hypothetical protein